MIESVGGGSGGGGRVCVSAIAWHSIVDVDVDPGYLNTSVPLVTHLAPNVTSKFVLYTDRFNLLYDLEPVLVVELQERLYHQGALAVFLLDTKAQAGFNIFLLSRPAAAPLHVPLGFIGSKALSKYDLERLREADAGEGVAFNITFMGWDPNPWEHFYSTAGFYVWMVSLLTFHVVVVLWGFFKLFEWFYHHLGSLSVKQGLCGTALVELLMSLPVSCLSFEILGTALRTLCIASRMRDTTILKPVFDTIYFPFTLSGSLIMIFFWLDVTSDSLYQGQFMDKMRIPAFVSMALLFVIELALLMCQFMGKQVDMRVPVFVVYVLVMLALAGIYFVAGYKVLQRLKEGGARKSRYVKITLKIIVSGVCYVVAGLLAVLFNVPGAAEVVASHWCFWYFIFFFLCCVNALQVSIFDVPARGTSSTRSVGQSKDKRLSVAQETSE